MNISVRSILGKKIVGGKKECVSGVYFSCEMGKITGIISDKKKFYPCEDILFSSKNTVSLIICANAQKSSGENWIGFSVFSEKEKHLGEISDIEFEPNLCIIQRIMVTNAIFGVPFSQHIFPLKRIIKVEKKSVTVNTNTQETSGEFSPAL